MIYLDYQATTPLAPEAAAAMRPWVEEKFANPHSPHKLGREAAAVVEVAREQVLDALGTGGKLHFTSGATEAANWALKGSKARRIVTLASEHACVLDTVEWLAGQGHEIEILPVGRDGLVDLNLIEERVTDGTGLVAAMLVNNEIGVIQPVAEIARIAHAKGALFFCDAVQGFGRVPLPLESCDLVALSAHKIHGPKGIGALWVKDGVRLEPFMHGGGQEGGLRSGTLSPTLCAGFGAAAKLAAQRREADSDHVFSLFSLAHTYLGGWAVNGALDHRYFGNLNFRREGLDVARLMSDLRDIAFSAGSACASGSGRPSHVLRAIGLSDAEARSSIRLGFGRYTKEEELVSAINRIVEAADGQKVRRMTLIRFISADGLEEQEVLAPAGSLLLDIAQQVGQPLEGTCEGQMACSTCHVVIAAEDFDKLPRASEDEEDMLDLAAHVTRRSRLACQVRLTEELESLTVHIPSGFHNMQGR